jgi:hypothetical protein
MVCSEFQLRVRFCNVQEPGTQVKLAVIPIDMNKRRVEYSSRLLSLLRLVQWH